MHPKETEDNLLLFLQKQEYKNKIPLLYNFKWECYRLVHIHFCLLDVKCNWWVTDVYKPTCSTGSVNIEPNFRRVEISDSLKKDIDEYQSMIDMLQR
jgi:hypothetical protein